MIYAAYAVIQAFLVMRQADEDDIEALAVFIIAAPLVSLVMALCITHVAAKFLLTVGKEKK